MIVPSRTAVAVLAAGAVAAIVAPAFGVPGAGVVAGIVALNAAVLALVVGEGRSLRRAVLSVNRSFERPPRVGTPATLTLAVTHRGARPVRVAVRHRWWSGPAQGFAGEPFDHEATLPASGVLSLTLACTPTRRGSVPLAPTRVDLFRPMGWAVRREAIGEPANAEVLLSLGEVSAYDALRRSRALSRIGIHRQRPAGAGREFDRIREYAPGDDHRDVNWKATARSGVPRTNVYQVERSRDVVICLDGGRLMGNPIGERTTLDVAVDSALLLAHASRQSGDRVGLITFRDRVETVLPPAATPASASRMLRTLSAFGSAPVATDFYALHDALWTRQRKRALVFILTDLSDPQHAEGLLAIVRRLARRHAVITVSLEDRLVEDVAAGPAETEADAACVLAAARLSMERRAAALQIRRSGAMVLMSSPEHLSFDMVRRYLEVCSAQLV